MQVLAFYKFALRPDARFRGTVVFDVKASETNPSFVVTVRVDPTTREWPAAGADAWWESRGRGGIRALQQLVLLVVADVTYL